MALIVLDNEDMIAVGRYDVLDKTTPDGFRDLVMLRRQ